MEQNSVQAGWHCRQESPTETRQCQGEVVSWSWILLAQKIILWKTLLQNHQHKDTKLQRAQRISFLLIRAFCFKNFVSLCLCVKALPFSVESREITRQQRGCLIANQTMQVERLG